MSKYTESVYREVLSQRQINDSSFAQGIQEFLFSCGGNTSVVPSKSYFRFEIGIFSNRPGTTQPRLADGVAPADNICATLYNNVQVYAGGRQVSQIVNGVPQASSLKKRLLKSGAWLEQTGKDAYLSSAHYSHRAKYVSSDSQMSSLSDNHKQVPLSNVPGAQRSPTVAISGDAAGSPGTLGDVTGVNTTFLTQAEIGDTLVVNGFRFQVAEITDNVTMKVLPAPTDDIVATNNAYIVRQEPRAAEGRNKFYVLWQPPVGFFDMSDPLPAGDYRVSMNPAQNYKKAALESLYGAPGDTIGDTDFDVQVLGVQMYLYTAKMSLPMELKEMLFEQNIQSKPFTTSSNTLNFTIPSSTKAISIWFQSDDVGYNPLIPATMFKTFSNPFGSGNTPYLSLESIQLTYANTSKPSTRWSSTYNQTTSELQQRWRDAYADAGTLVSAGGCESYEDWLTRGAVYHFDFSRSADDSSTELQVSANFNIALGSGASMFVCAWYTRVAEFVSRDGSIQSVESRVA